MGGSAGGFLTTAGGTRAVTPATKISKCRRPSAVTARAGQLRKGGNQEDFARASPGDGAVCGDFLGGFG